jgi:hypothetical protein
VSAEDPGEINDVDDRGKLSLIPVVEETVSA